MSWFHIPTVNSSEMLIKSKSCIMQQYSQIWFIRRATRYKSWNLICNKSGTTSADRSMFDQTLFNFGVGTPLARQPSFVSEPFNRTKKERLVLSFCATFIHHTHSLSRTHETSEWLGIERGSLMIHSRKRSYGIWSNGKRSTDVVPHEWVISWIRFFIGGSFRYAPVSAN